jgi:hypothetical protein
MSVGLSDDHVANTFTSDGERISAYLSRRNMGSFDPIDLQTIAEDYAMNPEDAVDAIKWSTELASTSLTPC